MARGYRIFGRNLYTPSVVCRSRVLPCDRSWTHTSRDFTRKNFQERRLSLPATILALSVYMLLSSIETFLVGNDIFVTYPDIVVRPLERKREKERRGIKVFSIHLDRAQCRGTCRRITQSGFTIFRRSSTPSVEIFNLSHRVYHSRS